MATVTPLSVIPSEAPAPGFTAGARILAEEGFDPGVVLWIFARTLEIADPLAAEMALISSEAGASRQILKAARR